MSAQFLSAKELEIEQWELDGLVWTLNSLESGKLVHDTSERFDEPFGFNMNESGRASFDGCGTVCCIGGWVYAKGHSAANNVRDFAALMARDYVFNKRSKRLARLYYPAVSNYEAITPKDAAGVLRRFLTTNIIDWEDVDEDIRLREPDQEENE